jgi:hypothetical protein
MSFEDLNLSSAERVWIEYHLDVSKDFRIQNFCLLQNCHLETIFR